MSGRVIVLGSVNVDLLASVSRLPRAGETIAGQSLTRQLGGKGANQAVAASRAGVFASLIGAVGDDAEGQTMRDALVGYDVDIRGVISVPEPTGHAIVVTSSSDNQIVIIAGANKQATRALGKSINIRQGDVCLTQMETPIAAAIEFFRSARDVGATTILNAAPASGAVRQLLALVDVLVVNESELAILSGAPVGDDVDDDGLKSAINRLGLAAKGGVIVTLGARGAAVAREGRIYRLSAQAVTVVDTTGAGDCFCGYLSAALARGEVLESAAVEANVAASVSVQSLGAASSVPLRSQIMLAIAAAQREGS